MHINHFQSNDLLASNPIDNNINIINPLNLKKNNFQPALEKSHTFLVCSDTRNFSDASEKMDTLFNFRLKFNPSLSVSQKTPIYENNPTLPQNNLQRKLGVLGNTNINFLSNQSKGNIIGYDTILYSGEKGCQIYTLYKNIIDFSITYIEIPRDLVDFYNPSLQTLTVSIPELSGFHQIHTSNGMDENVSFCFEPFYQTSTSICYKNMNSILFTVPTNLLTTYNVQLKLPFINEKKNIDALYIKECAVSQDSIIFTFINSNDSKDSKLLFKSTSKIKFENTFFVIDVLDSTSVKFTKTFLNFLVSSGEVLTFSEYSPENATITFQFSSLIENYGHLFSNITHSSDLFFGVFTPASSNPKIINMSLQILLKFQIKTKEDVSQ